MKRCNLLFIMTDEQRFDAVGYQNPCVKTPNLDAPPSLPKKLIGTETARAQGQEMTKKVSAR